MITRILIVSLALVLGFGTTACRSSKKKDKFANKPAAEMEANFKQRWVDKRTTDLVTKGVPAADARTQASEEFDKQFPYTGGISKPSKH